MYIFFIKQCLYVHILSLRNFIISGPPGREVKSLEHMTISPKGEKLAFRGASGYIHICNGTTKQWMMEVC